MYQNKEALFLPLAIVEALDPEKKAFLEDQKKLVEVKFFISASTKNGDYRCRKLDYNSINIDVTDANAYPDAVLIYIEENTRVSCSDRKYPNVDISGCIECESNEIYGESSYGRVSFYGYVWVYFKDK